MIDVLITKKPDEPLLNQYMEQCLESLHGQPCKIYFNDFHPDGPGSARCEALKQGDSKYVAFVDPDDYIINECLSRALYVLAQRGNQTSAYFTNHWILRDGNFVRRWFHKPPAPTSLVNEFGMHHIVVYKRSILEKHIEKIRGAKTAEARLLNLYSMLEAPVTGENYCGYVWRSDAPHSNHSNHKGYLSSHNSELWVERLLEARRAVINKYHKKKNQ